MKKNSKKEDVASENVMDGILIKKSKESAILGTGTKDEKIMLTKKTEFIGMKLSLPNKVVSQKKIKHSDLKIGDSVSVVLDENSKKPIALMVRQIIVAS